MFVFGRRFYYWVCFGFFLGIAFQTVPCKKAGNQNSRDKKWCKLKRRQTWKEAIKACSNNSTLLDYTDSEHSRYVRNVVRRSDKARGVWIGLKKNATNFPEVLESHLLKVEWCESANILRHSFENVSCTSLCEEKQHQRSVHEGMSSDAFPLCNISKLSLSNASGSINLSSVWTGRRYEEYIYSRTPWKWLDGKEFDKWKKWKIRIIDVGCRGCGFLRNKTIYLTSNCSQKLSYLCNGDRGGNITFSSLSKRQLSSWEDAGEKCPGGLLHLYRPKDKPSNPLNTDKTDDVIQQNTSYWLGIRNEGNCQNEKLKQRLLNKTQMEIMKCPYFNKNNHIALDNCTKMNLAICMKTDPSSNCSEPWKPITNKSSCWLAFRKVKMTWKAAHMFCLQQRGRLANYSDVKDIEEISVWYMSSNHKTKRYWLSSAKLKLVSRKDLLQGWYWSDKTLLNASNGFDGWLQNERLKLTDNFEEERCAFIRYKNNIIYWKDDSCDSRRRFICKPWRTRKEKEERFKLKRAQLKETVAELRRKISKKLRKQQRKTLTNMRKKLIRHINSCDFQELFNSSENGLEVDARTTVFDGLEELQDNTSTLPNVTIRNLCQEQLNCTVTKLQILSKDLPVDISDVLMNFSPLVPSDILVLDYIVNGEEMHQLDENISLFFSKKVNVTRDQVICLFLDNDTKWNTTGMEVGSIDRDTIECLTNHLSTFTVVLVTKDGKPDKALSIITYIGSGMSLAALLVTCVVYAVLYKDLQILTTSRHLVHLNLQIALGLTQIVFLAGGRATHHEGACKFVAILVHYFSLAGFVWILLEAVMLYLKLFAVYRGEFVRIKTFLIFGWGFPLLLVGISAGPNSDVYWTDQWCWLSYKDGFLWVVFAPIIIITVVGLVTVIAVLRVILVVSKSDEASVKKRIICAARGVVILFPTLGLSWGFSVIAVNHDALVWKYLFAITNSVQGFLIFLIYGVCNREIREAFVRKLGYDHSSSSVH